MVISVRLRAPCEDETGLDWPKFPAQEAEILPTYQSAAAVALLRQIRAAPG